MDGYAFVRNHSFIFETAMEHYNKPATELKK